MSVTGFFRSRVFGWTIYGLLIVGLIATFRQIMLFEERQVIYFNNDFVTSRVDGKMYFRYRDGKPQPTVQIDLMELDLLRHALKCRIRIDRFQSLKIRMLHVTSWSWPRFFKEQKAGPHFEAYFLHPTEEDIYAGKMQDVEYLDREFLFKVEGRPVLYPFDSYRAEFGIDISHVAKAGEKAAPLRVTTLVQDYLAAFHMADVKHELTFQKEAAASSPVTPNSFSFTLVRDNFLRMFTVYIYAVAFVFLIYIGFRRTIQELLAQSLGYFAALWGIRNIIAGKVEVFPTLIDYLTLMLFTMLVVIIIGRLLHEYYKKPGPAPGPQKPG